MKTTRKFMAILMVFAMILSMGVLGAFADDPATNTGTITITPPAGVAATATNTYKIYKVFDAVASGDNISYKLVAGKTTAPAGFTVDDAGNVTYATKDVTDLTTADITAIAAYVTEADLVATVETTGNTPAEANNLPSGYYYITTTTGTVVTIDSSKPNATVDDKNIVPKLDKKITDASSVDEGGKKALAQVGTSVKFDATITVSKGAKGYVFHDTMDSSLKYNNDVEVYIGTTKVSTDNYTADKEGDDTFTVTFKDEYIKTLAENTELVVKYSATVTSDALTRDPANNTAYLSYGDENSNNRTPDSTTSTYNAKFTVNKQDGDNQPLAGAGFVIKNADGDYYQLADGVVTWVGSIGDATEYTSGEDGKVTAFTGLANGTYTLVEKTVPSGYNKAADKTFTIAEHDYEPSNLEQTATVTNNAGAELPSTGAMGTVIFIAVGSLIAVAAVCFLVTKKRMQNRGMN